MRSRSFFQRMDERNKLTAFKIIAIMYFLTIIALQAVILYRQFALGQSIHDFEDFAIILTINSLFLIAALLYFGAIPLQKLRIKYILLFYAALVIAGSLFTYVKYNVLQSPGLTLGQFFDKLFIIFTITALIVFFWIVLSVFGKKRLNKEIEA